MERHTRNEIPGPKQAVVLRLPVPLHEALTERAGQEMRSVNAHVTYLIERDLKDGDPEPIAA